MSDRAALLKGIRVWLALFVVCLVLSGATAFPLVHELRWTESALRALSVPEHLPGLMEWISRVRDGLDTVDAEYPFVLYGTDWLAFAHLVIAVAFYGPYRDPVRNIWVVEFGMIACAGIIPLAWSADPSAASRSGGASSTCRSGSSGPSRCTSSGRRSSGWRRSARRPRPRPRRRSAVERGEPEALGDGQAVVLRVRGVDRVDHGAGQVPGRGDRRRVPRPRAGLAPRSPCRSAPSAPAPRRTAPGARPAA